MDIRYYFNDAAKAVGALNDMVLNIERPEYNFEDYYYTILVDYLAEYGHRNKMLFIKETVHYDHDTCRPINSTKEVIGEYGDYTEIAWRELCFDIYQEADKMSNVADPYEPTVIAENAMEFGKFLKAAPKEKIFSEYHKVGKVLKRINPAKFDPDAVPLKFYSNEGR